MEGNKVVIGRKTLSSDVGQTNWQLLLTKEVAKFSK